MRLHNKFEHLLVENRYTAEWPTRPLCKISFKLRVQGLYKWAHERDLEQWSGYGALPFDIHG